MENVEFISYDGAYPCLCHGTLVLKINGFTVSFKPYLADGESFDYKNFKDGGVYPSFWISGGCVHFENDFSDYEVKKEPWELQYDSSEYPEEIESRLNGLIELFNESVRLGCCGGCA